MREVAKQCDIDELCKMLDVTFDEQVQAWHARYGDGDT
jgi:RNA polymerase-interacting CarD/CdnL/TRCF family regulator